MKRNQFFSITILFQPLQKTGKNTNCVLNKLWAKRQELGQIWKIKVA